MPSSMQYVVKKRFDPFSFPFLFNLIRVMKMKIFKLIFVLYLLSIDISPAFAQDTACIDNARTNKEVNKCDDQLVPPKEMRIEREFNRLLKKYDNNKRMKEFILLTKNTWEDYFNILCNFEGAAAAKGQTKGILPVEAKKIYLECFIRELDEIESVLNKY